MRRALRLAAGLALALLVGCATVPRTVELSPAQRAQAQAAQQARDTALRAQPRWSLEGRIAVSADGKGGSGRIDWNQDGAAYEIALSAPVTRQSWRLSGDATAGHARLEGIEGGPRSGPDAQALLRETTGWTIPVRLLPQWVRGLVAADAEPAQSVEYGADGRLVRIVQTGWVIEYPEWQPGGPGQPDMPRRIVARRADANATVRLAIDAWRMEPAVSGRATASTPKVVFAIPARDREAGRLEAIGVGDTGTLDALGPGDAASLQATLAGLDQLDPAIDMRRNVARGDRRPVGVCGYSCDAPGLPVSANPLWPRDLRLIDGTGDVVMSDQHRALKDAARRYAAGYNRALSEWLARDTAGTSATGDRAGSPR